MISPYTAVGLVPTVRGIRKREEIKINLDHLAHLVKAAAWLSSLDLPVRLIAIPEGDRKSTRLNSSHRCISYAVFCLKKKSIIIRTAAGVAADDHED